MMDGKVDPKQLQILADSGDLEQLNNYIHENSKKGDFNHPMDGDGYDNGFALRYAAWFGHLELLNSLLKIERVRNAIPSVDNYALLYSAANGHLDVENKLREFHQNLNFDDAPPPIGYDRFSSVDENVDPKQLQILADSGDLEQLNNYIFKNSTAPSFTAKRLQVEGYGNSYALRYAAEHGNLELLNTLLKIKLVQNAIGAVNHAALRYAASNGHLPIVKRLLEFEEVAKKKDLLSEVLEWSILGGQINIINWLLAYVDDPKQLIANTRYGTWQEALDDVLLRYNPEFITAERQKQEILCLLQVMSNRKENFSDTQFYKLISLGDQDIIHATIRSPTALRYIFTNLTGDDRVKYLQGVAAVKARDLPDEIEVNIIDLFIPEDFKIATARETLQRYIESEPSKSAIRKSQLTVYEQMLPEIVKYLQNAARKEACQNPLVTKYAGIIRETRSRKARKDRIASANRTCDELLKQHGFDLDHLALPNAEGKTALDVARTSKLKERGFIIKEIKKRIETQNDIAKKGPSSRKI